ncbi:MAG: alanine--tRNA ligase, partial [Legionellaceae bacterium]
MNSSAIRQAFLDFFKERNHTLVPTSPLVPANDPTLLFTNAGMVQFKETFLGLEKRAYTRAASVQRCVRAGGKHNDLDNVGYTARHHTFFEMLGNFSFGDYFKREAIQFAWDFLTQVLKLPKEKLWITVYQEDNETADIWLNEMGVSPARFSRCGEKDNFWQMGDTGPCGPCTEIFYDHGPDIAGGPPGSADAEGDRYIEIWNIVFMQFNRDTHGVLHPLPKPSVDTGMGLERIAAVVQGVHSNYEIDSFRYLIHAIRDCSENKKLISPESASLKVIADHIRACAFLIVDGVLPGNEGRGYVLRRIIRRAVRHGHQLGLPKLFFSTLVKPLIHVMGDAYPELETKQDHIVRVLADEEQQFGRTLDQGLKLLEEEIKGLQSSVIPGEVAFKLYDTYGFPLDLTADIAREYAVTIDQEGFDRCMQRQREQSQSASAFRVDYSQMAVPDCASVFEGYSKNNLESSVLAMYVEGKAVESIQASCRASIILDQTPFYAESGGQVGDQGHLISLARGVEFRVDDTQRLGHAIVHEGELLKGSIRLNDVLFAKINESRRDAVRLNHTATHLLHAALKLVLGEHVQQKGSLVDAERARFDFVHYEPVTAEQCETLETLVNAKIRANLEVATTLMSMDDAAKSGAVALFGEKYGEEVRVLSMGDFSKELCGGTHASRTGDLGLFKITAEYGVASGVRRIELVTGEHALRWVHEQLSLLDSVSQRLKSSRAQVLTKLDQAMSEAKAQDKRLLEAERKLTAQSGLALLGEFEVIGGKQVLIKRVDGMDMEGLRQLLDQLKSRVDNA